MLKKLDLKLKCSHSEGLIVKNIEDELIIVSKTLEVVAPDDEIFTLDETGRAVWERLDGKHTLEAVIRELVLLFEAAPEQIENDVLDLVELLLSKELIVIN